MELWISYIYESDKQDYAGDNLNYDIANFNVVIN